MKVSIREGLNEKKLKSSGSGKVCPSKPYSSALDSKLSPKVDARPELTGSGLP